MRKYYLKRSKYVYQTSQDTRQGQNRNRSHATVVPGVWLPVATQLN
jgi:hypothetical protein